MKVNKCNFAMNNTSSMASINLKGILAQLNLTEENAGISTGKNWIKGDGKIYESISPSDGSVIATVKMGNINNYNQTIKTAEAAFPAWKLIPAPKRGELVREIGNALRENKEMLAVLISLEVGKIYQESLGEVQEMIDIADFAVGLSRQLNGKTLHSERPNHRLYEQYHPLGIVGIVSAFNFPVAVWAWNAMIALVCGNVVVWKPATEAMLSAIATQKIIAKVLAKQDLPEGIVNLITIPSNDLGNLLFEDKRISLLSFTGSTRKGRQVAKIVGERLGKSLLELGGNNAIIITPEADIDLAIRAITFSAIGTSGQRCTSARRIIIHESIYEYVREKLLAVYKQLPTKIGHPLLEDTLIGPLISKSAVNSYQEALLKVVQEGGTVLFGNEVLNNPPFHTGHYVMPSLVEAKNTYKTVQEETFAPILYLLKYVDLEDAIKQQNNVPQGLSSSLFSENLKEVEYFLSHAGSDCGIANINIGTSGAEIGGAFGGEKDTGGGREAGSDAWKAYMRRQTNTINYGGDLPLAQGITFNL